VQSGTLSVQNTPKKSNISIDFFGVFVYTVNIDRERDLFGLCGYEFIVILVNSTHETLAKKYALANGLVH